MANERVEFGGLDIDLQYRNERISPYGYPAACEARRDLEESDEVFADSRSDDVCLGLSRRDPAMKNAILLGCLVVVLFTTGCGDKPNAADTATAENDESRACAEQGGDWRRVCLAQRYQCVNPHSDAGKACSDSSECEGECLVELGSACNEAGECKDPEVPEPGAQLTGVCQRDDDPCGSFVFVREGRAQPVVHRD